MLKLKKILFLFLIGTNFIFSAQERKTTIKEWFDLIRTQNLTLIEDKLKLDKRIANYKDENKATALFYAIAFENVKLARLLVGYEADIEATFKTRSSALWAAAGKGLTEMVQFLLENKADVESRNKDQTSALAIACGNGHLEVAKLLIQNKAEIDSRSKFGDTPLILAAFNRKHNTVDLLLQSGANIDAKNHHKVSALLYADRLHDRPLCELILFYQTKRQLALDESIQNMTYQEYRKYLRSLQPETIRSIPESGCATCCRLTVDTKLSACGRCKKIFYCSKECQQKDWPKHKLVCKKIEAEPELKIESGKQIKEQPIKLIPKAGEQTQSAMPEVIAKLHEEQIKKEQERREKKERLTAQLKIAVQEENIALIKDLKDQGLELSRDAKKLLHNFEKQEDAFERKIAKVQSTPKSNAKNAKPKNPKNKPKNSSNKKQQVKSKKVIIKSEKLEALPQMDSFTAEEMELFRPKSKLDLEKQAESDSSAESETEESIEDRFITIAYGDTKIKVDLNHIIKGFAGFDGKYHGLHLDLGGNLIKAGSIKQIGKEHYSGCFVAEIIDPSLLKELCPDGNFTKTFFPKAWNVEKLIQALLEALENCDPESISHEGKDIVISGNYLPKHGEHPLGIITIKIILSIDAHGLPIVKTAYPINLVF